MDEPVKNKKGSKRKGKRHQAPDMRGQLFPDQPPPRPGHQPRRGKRNVVSDEASVGSGALKEQNGGDANVSCARVQGWGDHHQVWGCARARAWSNGGMTHSQDISLYPSVYPGNNVSMTQSKTNTELGGDLSPNSEEEHENVPVDQSRCIGRKSTSSQELNLEQEAETPRVEVTTAMSVRVLVPHSLGNVCSSRQQGISAREVKATSKDAEESSADTCNEGCDQEELSTSPPLHPNDLSDLLSSMSVDENTCGHVDGDPTHLSDAHGCVDGDPTHLSECEAPTGRNVTSTANKLMESPFCHQMKGTRSHMSVSDSHPKGTGLEGVVEVGRREHPHSKPQGDEATCSTVAAFNPPSFSTPFRTDTKVATATTRNTTDDDFDSTRLDSDSTRFDPNSTCPGTDGRDGQNCLSTPHRPLPVPTSAKKSILKNRYHECPFACKNLSKSVTFKLPSDSSECESCSVLASETPEYLWHTLPRVDGGVEGRRVDVPNLTARMCELDDTGITRNEVATMQDDVSRDISRDFTMESNTPKQNAFQWKADTVNSSISCGRNFSLGFPVGGSMRSCSYDSSDLQAMSILAMETPPDLWAPPPLNFITSTFNNCL